MKKSLLLFAGLGALSLTSLGVIKFNDIHEANAWTATTSSKLNKNLDLNDASAETIRNYYSNLNSLPVSERTGTNLLKNLKPILKNNQIYYAYDGTNNKKAIWQMYEIIDRDWDKSPASEINGYNPNTNTITGYSYGSSLSSKGSNPYIHALYVNRDIDNQTRAWDDHEANHQWSINQEHIWPKSAGFENEAEGGARGDPMHLWAGNGRVNSTEHSNYFYGYVDLTKSYVDPVKDKGWNNLSGNYKGVSKTLGTGTVFEPQDCDKGDIARAVFYMAARYNYLAGSDIDAITSDNPNLQLTNSLSDYKSKGYQSTETVAGKLGIISDLLEWNRLDPVDEFEIHRNNLLFNNYTNNRNPFIDFPDWADIIWGESAGGISANPQTDRIGQATLVDVVTDDDKPFAGKINLGTSTNLKVSDADGGTNVEWVINDETIASIAKKSEVNPSGKIQPKSKVTLNLASDQSITITPLKAGSTKLTIKAIVGGQEITKSLTITVVDPNAKPQNDVELPFGLTPQMMLIIGLVAVAIIVIVIVVLMISGNKKAKKLAKKVVKKTVKSSKKKSSGKK